MREEDDIRGKGYLSTLLWQKERGEEFNRRG